MTVQPANLDVAKPTAPAKMLIDRKGAADMANRSPSTFDRMRTLGLVPKPHVVRVDARGRVRTVLWLVRHIERWIEWGEPDAKAFERRWSREGR